MVGGWGDSAPRRLVKEGVCQEGTLQQKLEGDGEASVLIIYDCITNDPQAWKLKAAKVYYLSVSEGQEFQSSLARWLWPRISHEAGVQLMAGVASPEGLSGVGGSASTVAPSCGSGQEASLLLSYRVDLCTEPSDCPHDMEADFP